MQRILVSFYMLMLITSGMPTRPAYACTCVRPTPTLEQMFERVNTVLTGKVITVDHVANRDGSDVRAKLEVLEGRKGALGQDPVDIWTEAQSGACGVQFEVGNTYLIHAQAADDGRLRTNLCLRNELLIDTGNNGAPTPFRPAASVPTPDNQSAPDLTMPSAISAIAAFVLLATAAILGFQRVRH